MNLTALSRFPQQLKLSSEYVLPVLMAAILGAMVVPLPSWLLDVGLAMNLATSVALLVAAITVKDALEVTSFPTLLLVTTLFRLALNVSSTRLALAEGHAGEVIQAFGEFVVRGDYVVGAVIFAILTLVQFLVVAKGAERVAEVSARFTLDAMPGKQMSIDADLRAGAIDPTQARARRRALERESQMFGAMDGAMKFVKGDVLAGLVIVLVNLLGGIAVGVFQNGMDLSDAASTYALIAIGDGLVSQLPSLCIAVAAGLVVTRVASDRADLSLGAEIGAQFFGHPTALYVVSGLCLALALMPGMPRLTFLAIALAAGAGGFRVTRGHARVALEAEQKTAEGSAATAAARAEASASVVGVAALTLDLGTGWATWVSERQGTTLKQDLAQVRERLYLELGVRVPGIRIRTGAAYLPVPGYQFLVDEVPAGQAQLDPEALYVSCRPEELAFLKVVAEPFPNPPLGRVLSRVPPESRGVLEAAQVKVLTARDVVLAHVGQLIRRHAAQLLGVQDVQALLETLEPFAPALVKAAVEKVPLPLLTDVLRKLVHEDVSIRNLRSVLEALVAPTAEGDASALAERCRQQLHRYFSHKYAGAGALYAYLLDPKAEEVLRDHQARGQVEPERIQALLDGVKRVAPEGFAVVLTAPDVRRTLRRLCEGSYPEVAVLSYGELNPEQQIRPVGRLALATSAA